MTTSEEIGLIVVVVAIRSTGWASPRFFQRELPPGLPRLTL